METPAQYGDASGMSQLEVLEHLQCQGDCFDDGLALAKRIIGTDTPKHAFLAQVSRLELSDDAWEYALGSLLMAVLDEHEECEGGDE